MYSRERLQEQVLSRNDESAASLLASLALEPSGETACFGTRIFGSREILSRLKILRLTLGAVRRMTTTVIDKEEARKRLTPLQWHVTQEKGTER